MERNGDWMNDSISVSVIFMPTNEKVYGFSSSGVPSWNIIEPTKFGKLARLSHSTIKDFGMLIVGSALHGYQNVKCDWMG